LTKRRTQ